MGDDGSDGPAAPPANSRAAAREMITCIFCGKAEPKGKDGEDIVSKWFAKEFHPSHAPETFAVDVIEGVTADRLPKPISRQSQTAAAVRLADVCQECNRGWMSVIEEAAKPVLVPLMQGKATTLDTSAANIITTWAQLKAITLDARMEPRRMSPAIAHEFYALRPMPKHPLLGVTLGRFNHAPGTFVTFGRNEVPHRVKPSRIVVGGVELQRTPWVDFRSEHLALAFENLILGVTCFLDPGAPPVSQLALVGDHVVGIWPEPLHNDTANWPPPVTTPTDAFVAWLT